MDETSYGHNEESKRMGLHWMSIYTTATFIFSNASRLPTNPYLQPDTLRKSTAGTILDIFEKVAIERPVRRILQKLPGRRR
jgi:hypothetical protein